MNISISQPAKDNLKFVRFVHLNLTILVIDWIQYFQKRFLIYFLKRYKKDEIKMNLIFYIILTEHVQILPKGFTLFSTRLNSIWLYSISKHMLQKFRHIWNYLNNFSTENCFKKYVNTKFGNFDNSIFRENLLEI